MTSETLDASKIEAEQIKSVIIYFESNFILLLCYILVFSPINS